MTCNRFPRAAVLLVLAGCSAHTGHTTQREPRQSPAIQTPVRTTAPVQVPPSKPAATSAPHATAVPTAAPPPRRGASPPSGRAAATIVYAPPDSPPKIVSYRLSSTTLHGGDVVTSTVYTSSNVASVELRIGGYSVSMRKSGVGRFSLSYSVPSLPFFLHRTYTMEIVARNTRGDATQRDVPVQLE